MRNNDCFGCTKQGELNSLRAAVKRFEDGREFKKLADEPDRSIRKYDECEKGRLKLSEENRMLRSENRSLLSSEKSARERYERLLSLYGSLSASFDEQRAVQSEECFARIEEVVGSLNDSIAHAIAQHEEDLALMQKLKSQIAKDNTNSSIPTSQKPNHKTPPNNREKTGRKPGGQKGHAGHKRRMLAPTEEVHRLPAPDYVIGNPDYYKTGRTIVKQLIRASLKLEVIQYEADEYRNHKTREKVHAEFPEGLVNEVEYDASVSALIALLHSHGNMSYDKIMETLSDLTDGVLTPSKGMMANLEKKFSDRSVEDRRQIFSRMLVYPYMHIDGTTVRVNGQNGQVLVETSPAGTLLFHTGVKGDKAVKGTPAEDYGGTAIHDGESTFFHYGKDHQGCLVHELRYLKGSMDNEPNLTWASTMRGFLQFVMHYVNEVKGEGRQKLSTEEIESIKEQYSAILELAKTEYGEHPPNRKYYIEGYNTMKRLEKNKEYYLRFLSDLSIPYQNNPAELVARKEKMHSKQSGGYRSDEYSQYHCDVLSVMESNKVLGIGRFATLLDVFKRC